MLALVLFPETALVLSEAVLGSSRRDYASVSSLKIAIRSFGKKVLPEG
jgi:hypothetical protein